MPRFKLTIEYAGTHYSGWQIQKNARTVQGEIDAAVRAITGRKDFELYGSGRTDAGVHALGQVAHLDVATNLPAEALLLQLNTALPDDINILVATQVPHRFHARHHAVARRYLYQIARRRTADADVYAWWVREPLDLEAMRTAARAFVGMRDFRSFTAVDAREDAGEAPPSTLVLVDQIEIIEEGNLLLVRIQGSHFLWKMVRRMVGVLVAIGRGELPADAVQTFLAEGSTAPARLTAPGFGLFLERVFYEGDSPHPPSR